MITSVKILGKTYTVKQDPELADDNKFGLCNYRKQEITYSKGQHHDQLRDTILHESLHAIDSGISLDLKEEQIHALACAIYAMFKDNPKLLNWMFQEAD